MKYWIQHSNFKSDEYEDISCSEAISIFKKHNWSHEAEILKQLEQEGKENCPFGIGFVSDEMGILHICPNSDKNATCFFHQNIVDKFLGFIPITKQKTYDALNIPLQRIPNMIEDFFNKKVENLKRIKSYYF
jgi:hypothetical protein